MRGIEVSMQTLKEKFGAQSDCWEPRSEPVFRFWIDGECVGYPFFSLMATDYIGSEDGGSADDKLRLEFPIGTVVISGPKTMQFYDAFSSNCATKVKADGKDIVSVEFIVRDNGGGDEQAS
jgi:hypothetical protein